MWHFNGVNSIPEFELMGNFRIGIAYLKKLELLNILIQKYFFHDSPKLFGVPSHGENIR